MQTQLKIANSGVFLFGMVSVGWLVLGLALLQTLGMLNSDIATEIGTNALSTFIGFWALSVLDLAVMAKFFATVGALSGASGEARSALGIQVFIWGLFKLVCLGLFVLVLLKGHPTSMHGLLLGMGTIVVVPLGGGFIWSQRVLKNA